MSRQRLAVTVDLVVFSIRDGMLWFLVLRRQRDPERGRLALPEGYVGRGEALDAAAGRILEEETGIRHAYLEQLYTVDGPARDPRGHVVSVAYLGVVPEADLRPDAAWTPAREPPRLAFGHRAILQIAVERLRTKTEYSTVPLRFLPETFTLTEVQAVYEVLLERELDKRNFRRKMLALEAIEETERVRRTGAHRPARLYRLSASRPYLLKERGILFPF